MQSRARVRRAHRKRIDAAHRRARQRARASDDDRQRAHASRAERPTDAMAAPTDELVLGMQREKGEGWGLNINSTATGV